MPTPSASPPATSSCYPAGGATLPIPVYVLVGQPFGVIGAAAGLRPHAGRQHRRRPGFNTYALRTTKGADVAAGRNGQKDRPAPTTLALTQNHHIIDELGAAGPRQARRRQVRERQDHSRGQLRRITRPIPGPPRAGRVGRASSSSIRPTSSIPPMPGAWHRHEHVHRLQRLPARLPGRKQHSRSSARSRCSSTAR